jgi:hypothetical protein
MREGRIVYRLRAGLLCALLAFVACGTGEEPTLEQPPQAEESPADGATVQITEPAKGSTVEAGDVKVTVDPQNFNIVDKLGQDPVAGEGHVHFYFDVEEIPTTPGQPAVTADASTYHAAATTTYTWPDVEAGEHTFGVQLVNNNHTPLEPPVTAEVTVTVE